jgi:hypothetical protein
MSVVLPNATLLSVILDCDIMLSVIFSFAVLSHSAGMSVILLSAVLLIVILVRVMAPLQSLAKKFLITFLQKFLSTKIFSKIN